ncbi:glycosyltransferase family 2 protein [Nocardiopsis dassonvillei]|uniref:glycosyltransferase family 2 protein n=1 Tax=Nocardiopsis dassonvillei TaxID=2014 RepID=UPI00157DFFF2|nr:glycosyltransferase family 2 protein [Nocardiopsis dassonvillei]
MSALSTVSGLPLQDRPCTISTDPTVSVIVPTFNRPDRLVHALESLALQEGVQVEAIVVNDHGCDVTEVVRRAHRGGLHVELIDQPTNMGLPTARNTGIEVASGQYMAFLDDDDFFLRHHLQSLVHVLERGADVAYGDCPVSTELLDPATTTQERVDRIPYAFDYPYNDQALLVSNIIPVIAPVMRSLQGTGAAFDPQLPVQEDWDMFLQLQHLGMRFTHVPQRTMVYHRIPDVASMTTNPEKAGGNNARFRDTYRRLAKRWPVAQGSVAAEYREWIGVAYELAGERLRAGEPLSHFFYERVLRVVYNALTGVGDSGRLEADLTIAVAGEQPPAS